MSRLVMVGRVAVRGELVLRKYKSLGRRRKDGLPKLGTSMDCEELCGTLVPRTLPTMSQATPALHASNAGALTHQVRWVLWIWSRLIAIITSGDVGGKAAPDAWPVTLHCAALSVRPLLAGGGSGGESLGTETNSQQTD